MELLCVSGVQLEEVEQQLKWVRLPSSPKAQLPLAVLVWVAMETVANQAMCFYPVALEPRSHSGCPQLGHCVSRLPAPLLARMQYLQPPQGSWTVSMWTVHEGHSPTPLKAVLDT